jgi:hypothetical protein
MNLHPPSEADLAQLVEQLAVAHRLVCEQPSPRALDGSLADLDAIQAVLDSGRLQPGLTYELQCLGVAFGSVLIDAFDGLDWAIIDDEYGRDPTVRYRDTSVALNVLTLISKRVEDGERVDVRGLFEGLLREIPAVLSELNPAADGSTPDL